MSATQGLVGLDGSPLNTEARKQYVSGHKKKTPLGDVLFQLKIDMPKGVSHEDVVKYLEEYAEVLTYQSKGAKLA